MPVFHTDSVTIVRKKGDTYAREEITTAPFLPDPETSREEYRRSVIRRLRRDPSVVFVLEPKDGVCTERHTLPDGNLLEVRLAGTTFGTDSADAAHVPEESAAIRIVRGEEAFYGEDFNGEDGCLLEELCHELASILECVDAGDYSFLPVDCAGLPRHEPSEFLGFDGICKVLREAGYQTESVHTVGHVRSPMLFVHGNEVVLLGTHHFSGEDPFVEMKRLFFGVQPEEVRAAVKEVAGKGSLIDVIEWEDGSWSFRATLDDDLDEDNLVDRLLSDLGDIREFIEGIEEKVGEEPWSIMAAQRQLFIYETVSESIKLARLKI